jgi:glyoxylase-like metal-dependent hydrolase (beta-lactamase superfamily II)
MTTCRWLIGALLTLAPVTGAAAQAPPPPSLAQATGPIREITRIAGEVYRFRNNFHYSVFAVTPAGIIVTDPINASAAQWLKDELKQRFNQPVRYLVYSHDHADHISGGEVFADTAVVIAHANARLQIIGEKRPTALPQVTFTDRLDIELGGTTLELHYLGRNHSDNSLLMRFPREKVVFAVDWIPVKSAGFRDWPDAYLAEWIEGLKRVEQMEFDILAPGHGALGDKSDVRAFRGYMEEMRDLVLAALREGKSLADTKAEARAKMGERYKGWAGFGAEFGQMFDLNVEGMYRLVNANRRPN